MSMNVAGMIGNERIAGRVKSAVGSGRVSHAYIFDGPSGIGKTTAANFFAKSLQCPRPDMSSRAIYCGTCPSCRSFDGGNHPDVFYPVPTKTKFLGVDDVREQVVAAARVKPYAYPYKIYILENADATSAAAQNALLKILEDPPEYCVFMLLANSSAAFLPTVISRCVLMRLVPLPEETLRLELEKRGTPDADIYAAHAQGLLGRALKLAGSENFRVMRDEMTGLADGIERMELDRVFAQFSTLEKYKSQIQDALEILLLYYRDRLTADTGAVSKRLADFDAIVQAKDALRHNANFQLAMEVLLIKLSGVRAREGTAE